MFLVQFLLPGHQGWHSRIWPRCSCIQQLGAMGFGQFWHPPWLWFTIAFFCLRLWLCTAVFEISLPESGGCGWVYGVGSFFFSPGVNQRSEEHSNQLPGVVSSVISNALGFDSDSTLGRSAKTWFVVAMLGGFGEGGRWWWWKPGPWCHMMDPCLLTWQTPSRWRHTRPRSSRHGVQRIRGHLDFHRQSL